VQAKLFGRVEGSGTKKRFAGTGLVPGEAIGACAWRGAFEGTEQDVVWLDEEPPLDVYVECLVRTMTTDGLVMVTFTPLEDMSDVVMSFLEGGKLPPRLRSGEA
jgi:phage terminase large subunit-like protein